METVKAEKYTQELRKWFTFTAFGAMLTITKVFKELHQARRDMDRLRRHVEYNLGEVVSLLEDEIR